MFPIVGTGEGKTYCEGDDEGVYGVPVKSISDAKGVGNYAFMVVMGDGVESVQFRGETKFQKQT
jgi:hypothetical protein